jgi:hypothetical protein
MPIDPDTDPDPDFFAPLFLSANVSGEAAVFRRLHRVIGA